MFDYYFQAQIVTPDRTCYSLCVLSSSLVFSSLLLLTVDFVRVMRLLFIFASAMPIRPIRFVIEIFHQNMKHVEVLAGILFMTVGSCLFVIQELEDCYELNLMFMLVCGLIHCYWVCCEDFEPDYILEENFIDN